MPRALLAGAWLVFLRLLTECVEQLVDLYWAQACHPPPFGDVGLPMRRSARTWPRPRTDLSSCTTRVLLISSTSSSLNPLVWPVQHREPDV